MPSVFSWIDYDDQQRESMKRMLAFFRERESRDELGLGSIRDSIADKLFPGTSTIHTRLRYMLFVPWMYQKLEAQRAPAAEVAAKARKIELALIQTLLENEDNNGVIGRVARQKLKTLPSAVYWAGLDSWKILRFAGNQFDYHRAFDRLAERRGSTRRREDVDVDDEHAVTWHGHLPPAPEGFPKVASFALTHDEAEYLRDRISLEHPSSLLAALSRDSQPVPEVDFIWEHPRLSDFHSDHRALVDCARILAEVMHGAAFLYNLELSRLRGDRRLEDGYRAGLEEWVGRVKEPHLQRDIASFDALELWNLLASPRRSIAAATRAFVSQWFAVARAPTIGSVDSAPVRQLVRNRERSLKGAQSRFDNRVVLHQWAGDSGLMKLSYRWRSARTFLQDLALGLAAEGDAHA